MDTSVAEESADVTAVLLDGRRVHLFVEHATGSMQRPLSDAALDAKFHALVDPVLGAARADQLISQGRGLAAAADLRGLAALCQA